MDEYSDMKSDFQYFGKLALISLLCTSNKYYESKEVYLV